MKSMTGFGKAYQMNERYQIEVEIKSVNQRFLDIQFRMPRVLNEYENELRQLLKEYLTRGRVEVFISLIQRVPGPKKVIMDWSLMETVIQEVIQESNVRFESSIDPQTFIEKLALNDAFFSIQEQKEEETTLLPDVRETFERALHAIVSSREKEGELLKDVLFEQGIAIQKELAALRTVTSLFEKEYEEKLTKKLADRLEAELDQSRILTELVILLERGDIHEELDRLDVHLEQLNALLKEENPVGRELDFLIQELNREVNTIGSKSTMVEIKNHVVQLKTSIEKMREQVQNIE